MNKITVLVCSGSRLVKDVVECCLASHSDIELVGSIDSLDDLCKGNLQARFQILLLDLFSCCGQTGEQLTWLKTNQPHIQIIAFDFYTEEASVLLALSIGAHGYVCGNEGAQELIAAIRIVAAGNVYLCPGACGVLIREYRRKTESVGGE